MQDAVKSQVLHIGCVSPDQIRQEIYEKLGLMSKVSASTDYNGCHDAPPIQIKLSEKL